MCIKSSHMCIHIWLAGTGKSVTGAHLAYLFAEHNRQYGVAQDGRPPCVLYCAPSNKATDVVLG